MNKIEKLKQKCLCCLGCHSSSRFRVFSSMNPEAEVMVVGYRPEENLKKSDLLFSNQAGDFFLKYSEEILGLNRGDFYFTNVIKCSKNVIGVQRESCIEFLKDEVKIVNPKIIITLGSFAFREMSGLWGITKHHGVVVYSIKYEAYIIPLFYPSQPAMKNETTREMFFSGLTIIKNFLEESNG